MIQTLDDSLAILWGSEARSVHWVYLSRKHGKVSIASADPDGFRVTAYASLRIIEDIMPIADAAYSAWVDLIQGADLTHLATHTLDRNGNIVPLEGK